MHSITSTALGAGGQERSAQRTTLPFQPVTRRHLMTAVKTARRYYGLSTGDILVLDALLSFLPCRDRKTGAERAVTQDMLLVVYASNASLCARANGMDERVLRRHISRLVEVGFLNRKDSATGKRFPLRAEGRIRDAFGIDVTPLLHRYPEIAAEALHIEEAAEDLRSKRAEALAIRGRLLELCDKLGNAALSFLDGVKTILRRQSLTLLEVEGLTAQMMDIELATAAPRIAGLESDMADVPEDVADSLPEAVDRGLISTSPRHDVTSQAETLPADKAQALKTIVPRVQRRASRPFTKTPKPEDRSVNPVTRTDEKSGGNGRNVRQVEPHEIDPYLTADAGEIEDAWKTSETLASFYPDNPKTLTGLREILYQAAGFVHVRPETLTDLILRSGWAKAVKALDYVMEHVERISQPDRYIRQIAEKQDGALDRGQFL